jgi:hypothetical protein
MLALRAQHDDPDAPIGIERLEGGAQLLAFGHCDDVERRPVENNVGALAGGIDLDPETVEPVGPSGRTRRGRRRGYRGNGIGNRRVRLRCRRVGLG